MTNKIESWMIDAADAWIFRHTGVHGTQRPDVLSLATCIASHAPNEFVWWPAIQHQFEIEFGMELETRFGGDIANLMYSIRALVDKALASHAPSEGPVGFAPWCKDDPNCCGGKCFDSKWCCEGDGKDGHSPECRYSQFGYAEVKPPSEAAAQPTRRLKPGPHRRWCPEHGQAPPCTICDYEDVPLIEHNDH